MPESPPRPWRSRLRTLLRWSGRLLLVLLLAGVGAGIWGWQWFNREILSTIPASLGKDTEFRIPCSVQIYAADGARVDQFYLERRVWVPIAELPDHVWEAFVASEDRRFFEHEGVDFLGIARALVVNLRGGGVKQGGSTITQQLVKNLLVGKEKSYRRKMREAVLAWRLERELDKMELLELYVNYIALGNGNYGVEAAAQDYFGISARELDPGQAALLAGLVPAPSRYSPRQHPETAAARREQVLRLMVDQGYVTSVAASEHLTDPVLQPRVVNDPGPNTSYLTEVRREVRRLFGETRPFLEGLQIRTALDPAVQAVAEGAVRTALADLEGRQGARGPVRNIPDAARPAFLDRGDGLKLDAQTSAFRAPRAGECFSALAEDAAGTLRANRFRLKLGPVDLEKKVRTAVRDDKGEVTGRVPRPLGQVLRAGDVLAVCVPPEVAVVAEDAVTEVHLRDRPWAEASAVVLENATGQVVAVVGGYDVGLEGFVRATQARRQPGSSFKPVVYAAAILAGHRQTDIVIDAPFAIPGTNGQLWRPQNYDGKYHGPIPLRNAMALSLNTVAVRLGVEVGIDKITRLATALGVRSKLRGDLTVALGSSEVTPMDLAVTYASLAREGVHIDPTWITSVADRRGFLLGKAGGAIEFPNEDPIPMPGAPGLRVMPQAQAYVVVDMMRNVFKNGTAKKGQREGMDFAGKTGTTSNFVDAWFVGYSPRYTVAVWVGTDGQASIGDKETGGKAALPAWSTIMAALPNVPGERFPVPDDVALVPWGADWLGYVRGTAPSDALPLPQWDEDAPLPPFGYTLPGASAPPPPPPVPAVPVVEDVDDVEEGAGNPDLLPSEFEL